MAHHPDHHPKVKLVLQPLSASADAELHISLVNPQPARDSSTWLSADRGADEIVIPTYSEDFQNAPQLASGRGKLLHVGVYARPDQRAPVEYTLSVSILNVSPREMRKRAGLLRGGQVILPRDELAMKKAAAANAAAGGG